MIKQKTGYENSPTWELKNIRKALESLGGFFNTVEDDERLLLVRLELRRRA